MNRNKLIYWVATALVVLPLGFSGVMYFINPDMKLAFDHLGFPDYFRIELGTAKLIGVVLLLLPQVPARIKEWTYAGFGINLLSAAIAHASSGDGAAGAVPPLVIFVFLVISYLYYHKLHPVVWNAVA